MAIKTDHPPTIYRHLPNQALHLLHLKGTEVDQLDHCWAGPDLGASVPSQVHGIWHAQKKI